MATFTERIRFVVEAVTGNAERNLKNLRGEVAKAEGTVGKAKAGFASLGPALTTAAAGGAVALAGFAAKGVQAFQNVALAADNFATTSGLAVEDASRWIEVAADLGVSSEAVAKAFRTMNIAASKGKVEELGLDAEDAGVQFQNILKYLKNLPDEAKRAAEAQRLLGKSWMELAPLVAQVGELDERLGDVSEHKIIDREEVRKARELRDAMDKFNDSLDDLKLALGEDLVGEVTTFADALSMLGGVAFDLKDAISDLPGPLNEFVEGFGRLGLLGGLGNVAKSGIQGVVGWFSDSGDAADAAGKSFLGALDAITGVRDALNDAGIAALINGRKTIEGTAWWNKFGDAVEKATGELERADRAEARSNALERHREAAERATRAEERLAEAIRDRAAAALEGTNTILDMADAQANMNEAFDEWKKQHHEAVFAKELELDPAAEADEAAQSLRDAARAALRVVEMAAAAGGTEVEKANIAVQTLEQILRQAPWLQGLLGGTLANLRTATSASVPVMGAAPLGGVFGAVTAPSRAMAGAVNVTINNPPGTDGRQVARGFEEWTRVNGTANTSGLP